MNSKRLIYAFGLPLKILPRKQIVLFRSFQGQYNDSPKAISEKLHEMYPEIEQIWTISDKANQKDIPKYIQIVKYNSLKYYYYIYRSKIVIDNYAGIIYTSTAKKSLIAKLITKDKKQLNISTWHGTPLKRIGKYQKQYNGKRFYFSSDIVTANSQYVKDSLEDSFGLKNIELLGLPRNDIFFSESNKNELRKKLGLPKDKKIILFAPTFRNSLYESGEHQLRELKISALLNTLSVKFGGKWVFVARMHNEVFKKIDLSKYGDSVINGNAHDDMAEYLCASDVLLTDYSSSMFDYIYSKKPCFLYMLDRKQYEKDDRGFYIGLDKIPFSHAESTKELIDNIKKFNKTEYEKNCNKFLDNIRSIEDGKSSERIVELIKKFYDK